MKKLFFYLFAAAATGLAGCDGINDLLGGDVPEDIRVQSELDHEIDYQATTLHLGAQAKAPFSCKVVAGSAWLSLESEPGSESQDGRTPDAKSADDNPADVTYSLSKRIVVGENTGDTRTGKIIVYRDNELAAITITVKQWGEGQRPAYINLTEYSYEFNAEAGSVSFYVDANVEYSVDVKDGGSWLSVEPVVSIEPREDYDGGDKVEERDGKTRGEKIVTNGVVPNTYKISVTANTDNTPREGRIEVTDGNIKKTIAVTQAAPGNNGGGNNGGGEFNGKYLSFVGVPDGINGQVAPIFEVTNEGGNVEFTIYTNLEAYEPNTKEWPEWLSTPQKIRTVKTEDGIEDTYKIAVQPNTTGERRRAVISYHGWDRESGVEIVATTNVIQH